jgi:ubiquitin
MYGEAAKEEPTEEEIANENGKCKVQSVKAESGRAPEEQSDVTKRAPIEQSRARPGIQKRDLRVDFPDPVSAMT